MTGPPEQPSGPAADAAAQELDASGLYCPEPVMLLHNRIRDLEPGAVLRLTATDPSTRRDVPRFCLYLGHELIDSGRRGDGYVYLIRKGGGPRGR